MDSGMGGLSLLRHFPLLLPRESVTYYGDNAHCPYGNRSIEDIFRMSDRIIRFLIENEGCKHILIACNTVTSTLINRFRKRYSVPFSGIEPATRVAARQTRSGHIGILATRNTLEGPLYKCTREQYASHLQVHVRIGTGLVELVESGELTGQRTRERVENHVAYFRKRGVDQLVLGCTHFPFLMKSIVATAGKEMTVIDPTLAVVRRVKSVLSSRNISRSDASFPRYRFYSSGSKFPLQNLLPSLSLREIEVIKEHRIPPRLRDQ